MKNRARIRIIAVSFLFAFFANTLTAQTWNFAAPTDGAGSSGTETGRSICTDAAGNVYVVGVYNNSGVGNTDFNIGGGANTAPTASTNEGYIASYDKNGNYRWHTYVSGTGTEFSAPAGGICTNGTFVWAVGSTALSGSPVIVSGAGSTPITDNSTPTTTSTQAFLTKLNCSNGNVNWARAFGGSTNNDIGQGVCVDPDGCCYVIGSYGGQFTMNVVTTPTVSGTTDLFVAKFSVGGNMLRFMGGGTTGGEMLGSGGGLCYVPGATPAIIAVGSINSGGNATFGSQVVTNTGTSANDGLLLEMDTMLGVSNALVIGSGAANVADELFTAVYDPFSAGVYVCGYYGGTGVTFPGTTALGNSGGQDAAVARYNVAANNFTWSRSISSTLGDRAWGIAADGQGGILVSGHYAAAPLAFSGSAVSISTHAGGIGDDIFVAHYNTNGTAIWALRAGGAEDDEARGIACYVETTPVFTQHVFTTGLFQTSCTFGSTTLTADGTGNNDFFVARLNDLATPLIATQSQVNLTCNGVCTGSATVVASGGTAPYTYSWSPSGGSGATASSLCATNYTCTITDAVSTSITKTFNITQPPAIVITPISQTNVSCNGGSNGAAQVTASGGTGTLTYNWTPGNPTGDGTGSVTGLTAQVYTVTVTDANSCTATRTFNITQPPAIVVTPVSQTNVSCGGGSNGAATVSASGGTGTLSYNWTPGNPAGDGTNAVTGLTAGTWTCTVTDVNGCTNTATFNITAPPAIIVTPVSQTNVSCGGGSNGAASVNASGGAGGFSYNWTPGNPTGDGTNSVTGLTAQVYTVTVTDVNSCTGTATFNITAPPAIIVTPVSQTNISCNGGSNGAASVNASGGAGGFSYNWTPGNPTGDGTNSVTGLTAQVYTVTVTDVNSCTGTATFNITAPPAIIVTPVSQTNVSCNGGSNGAASVNASGGAGGFSYNWTPGNPTGDGTNSVTGLTAQVYTVTVTDVNSCTGSATFNITQPSPVVVTPVSQTNISCNGGSNGAASVNASGGAGGFSYNWTPGNPTGDGTNSVTGLTAQVYTVTVTDVNSCTGTATFNITQPPAISSSISSQTNLSCNGGSNGSATVSASGGTGSLSYSWAPSGGNAATASGLTAGTYTCTISDANGCIITQTVNITQPSAISSSVSSQTDVSCNGGSNGSLTVSASGGTGSLSYSWTPSGGNAAIATGLAAGTYTCTITDANGCTNTLTAVITEPSAISASISSQTNVSCNGSSDGSATVAASGGTGSLSYSWAPAGGNAATASGLSAATYTCTITDANGCTTTQTATITEPSPVVATVTGQTNVSCNGGSNGTVTISASGGTGSLTYSWAPSGGNAATASGLAAGTYTCTVTDFNGCTTTVTVTITEPIPLTASSSSTPATCGGNNGTATATPSGGTGPYAYAWAPSGGTGSTATSLTSGTYTCTVTDANGCITTTTVNVNSTGGISASITASSNVSCNNGNDGSATAAPIGGTGPYSYTWTPSGGNAATATGLAQGTYTCTITDVNGCLATTTVAITEPPAITSSVSSQTNISCNGGSDGAATIAASGGTGSLSYSWTPSGGNAATASGLAAGTYTCTITDANGCTQTQTVNITQPAVLVTILSAQADVSCNGGNNGSATVAASGGTPAYSYAWAPSGGTNATAPGLVAGTYTCTITDANGCTQTQTVTITEPGAISSSLVGQTNVSCNGGNNGAATITAAGGTGTFTYDWTPGNPTGDGTVSVSGLSAGTWTCTITDSNGCTRTQTVSITQPPALSRVMSKTDATCTSSNGTATATPSGGTPPYTYLWAPGGQTTQTATALVGGTYTCTITDANGCTIVGSITVNTLPCGPTRLTNATCGITVSSLSQQVFCIPVANATNYRYRWINTAQGLNVVFVRNANQTNCYPSWITGIQHGRTYTVEVSAFVGSAWTAYGTVCTVTTQPLVPFTQLVTSDCGSSVAALSELIYANAVPVASKYEWRISDPAVGFSVTYLRNVNTPDLRLQWITGIQYAHTYNVEVRAYVNGDWGNFGTVCTVTTPAFPSTQLTSTYCGATLPAVSTPIYCNPVLNATNYQWKVVNTALGYSSTLMRGSALTSWYLTTNGGILTNTTYTVTVRAYVGGVWGTFGPACTITTGPVQMAQDDNEEAMRTQEEICLANPGLCDAAAELTMDIYPNPFAENITVLTSPGVTSLAIYNSLGEFVRSITIENGKAELNLGDLVSGIYLIQAKTAQGMITKRIIKQE